MQKKNNKLESFLFKSLPEHKYERIRGYEACIVISEKENKAFKYVVLGDQWIYLTENPPRVIQEAVPLNDVNDFPDFLMGDDKKNCQHIAITYWTSEPVKRRSFRKKKSPRGSQSDLHGDRSNASTPLSMASSYDLWADEHSFNTSLSSLPHRPDSRGSMSSARESRKGSISGKKSIKKGKPALRTIQSESEDMILKSLKEELEEEDILEDIENQSELGESLAKSYNTQTAPRSQRSARSTRSVKSSRPLPSPVPNTKAFETPVNGNSGSSVINSNGLPKKQGIPPDPSFNDDSEPTSCCLKCCSFTFGKSKVSPLCGAGKSSSPQPGDKKRLFSASTDTTNAHTKSDVHIEITAANSDIMPYGPNRRSSIHSSVTTLRGHGDRAVTPAMDDIERRSVLSIASMSDYGGSMQRLSLLGMEGIAEKRRAVLNLYLLSSQSPMLMLIRSAWCNCLISATLMLNPEMLETPKGSVLQTSQRGRQEMLFQELKRDLLKPDNDIEDLFYLLNELKLATEKNFVLKRFFWKNADLFHFFVKKLQSFLQRSADKAGQLRRTNEFELITLLVDILCMMFHESEIIQERTQALKAERGKYVLALLMVLTCNPEIPEKRPGEKTIIDNFTRTSLGTVFELFLMAKQANWSHLEGNFYNISWMISTLEELRDTEKFIARVVDMMLSMISKSSGDRLSPADAVLLYQMFFVLNNFLQYSRRIKTFISTTYAEEFKYFVKVPLVMRKLPQTYPVYQLLQTQVDDAYRKHMTTK
ncbi:CL056-like protein [Mya arenaria]|uniref:CL056-like protein n=1 Tax=Mya arenaria TaxID=6604 RepID=A0ABY7FWI6_MYAAR|nr:CL056-like protein [Mya arenaria]